jgi:hypothetical protein
MLETLLAGLTLVICVALLLHMAIGPVRRERLRLHWLAIRRTSGLKDWRRLWPSRQRKAAARREADDVIERARRAAEKGGQGEKGERGEWNGNVYRPKSFDKRSPDRSERRPPPH